MKSYKTAYQILLEQMDKTPLTTKEREEVGKRFGKQQCSFAKNKHGKFFAYTHRARTKFYDNISDMPQDKVRFISSTS